MHLLRKNWFILLVAAFLMPGISEKAFSQNPPKSSREVPKTRVIARQEVTVLNQPNPGIYIQGKIIDPQHSQEAHLGYIFSGVVVDNNNIERGSLEVISDRPYTGDPKPLLAQAREDMVKRFNVPYESEKESIQEEMRRLEAGIEESTARESALMERLMHIQLHLPAPFTPQGFAEQVDRLKQQQFALRVEIAGLSARRQLILEKMEKVTPTDADKARLNVARATLKLRQAEIEKMNEVNARQPGSITESELQKARFEVMKAEQELRVAESALNHPADLEPLRQLLEQTELDLATAEARNDVVNQALGNIPTERIFEYQRLNREIGSLQKNRESLRKSLADQQDELSKLRPVKVRDLSPPQFAPPGGELPQQGMGGMGG
jgi:predicted  nucleic acid-binding Zn-ribbon protein